MIKLQIILVTSIILGLSFNYCFCQVMVQMQPTVRYVSAISANAIVVKVEGTSKQETHQIAPKAAIVDSAGKNINITDLKPGDKVRITCRTHQENCSANTPEIVMAQPKIIFEVP